MRKALFLWLSLVSTYCSESWGQQKPSVGQHINTPTENATAMTRYGKVPVNLSTGELGLSVPLHNINYNNISVPIELDYNSTGVRVDQYATWVGLGWNLRAGGAITRTVNGIPDDNLFPDPNGTLYANTEKGYLFCGNKLNNSNWIDLSTLVHFAGYPNPNGPGWNPNYLADGAPDDFSFSVDGITGTFFLDETGTWRIRTQNNIGIEIEHEVNSTPELFENCNTPMKVNKLIKKFIITAPNGTKYTFGGNMNALDFSRGTKDRSYMMQTGDASIYDLSPTAWYLTEILDVDGAKTTFTYERGLNLIRHSRSVQSSVYKNNYEQSSDTDVENLFASILSPCYLKSIENPLQKVEFFRSLTTQQTFWDGTPWTRQGPNGPIAGTIGMFDQQMWDMNVPAEGPNYRGWPDFRCNKYTLQNERPFYPVSGLIFPDYSQKLDSFVVSGILNQGRQKSVAFSYTNNANIRLFLDSVSIRGANGENGGTHSFNYFAKELLPNYASFAKDQWGYFNNSNYNTEPIKHDPDHWRLPVLDYALYGTLQQITYPTGGRSVFEYELNNYSLYQKVTLSNPKGETGNVSLVPVSNTNGGGLRIKKITSIPSYNSPPTSKQYFYYKNYISGGTTSSGILSGKSKYKEYMKPTDWCTGSGSFNSTFSDNEFNPYGEDVRNISYSEVTEVNEDGGKTVYKYTNFDSPGCLDELHLSPLVFGTDESDIYKLSSNQLERGLLISEESYKANNTKVKDKLYEYDYDPNRKTQFAKCIQRYDNYKQRMQNIYWWNPVCDQIVVLRLYPYKKYYYNIPLKKVTERVFEQTGTITTTEQFSYDRYGNVTTKVRGTSDGRAITESTKYNSDPSYITATPSGTDANALNSLFFTKKIKNYPIEQITMLGPSGYPIPINSQMIIAGTLYHYAYPWPSLSKIQELEINQPFQLYNNFIFSGLNGGMFSFDNRYKPQEWTTAFTQTANSVPGKPLAIVKKENKEAYTYDYSTQYVTSITQNASAGEVAFTSFEGRYNYPFASSADENTGFWDFNKDNIIAAGRTGEKCLRASGGIITTGAMAASTFNLTPGKTYILSWWWRGNAVVVKNGNTDITGSLSNPSSEWKYRQIKVVGNGLPVSLNAQINAPGTTDIDEIRLYPENAQMKSFTYDAILGKVTSVDDERGIIKRFRYDPLGRLLEILDNDNNILSKNTYNLQSAQ